MDCCNNGLIPWVARWFGFTDYVPTVPQLYWDMDSNEQRYHLLCKQLHKLVCYADMLGQKITIDHAAIEALEKEFEKFKDSGFEDYYLAQIEKWVNDNLAQLYKLLVKQIYFGLTDDGHFVAYIPESWEDIIFDTGYDYDLDTYGRLILRWDVDSTHSVTQTPYESNKYGIIGG